MGNNGGESFAEMTLVSEGVKVQFEGLRLQTEEVGDVLHPHPIPVRLFSDRAISGDLIALTNDEVDALGLLEGVKPFKLGDFSPQCGDFIFGHIYDG